MSWRKNAAIASIATIAAVGLHAPIASGVVGSERLEKIAIDVMTPVPKPFRTAGSVSRSLSTNTKPSRGLDMCMDRQRVGIYAPTPKATTTWKLDYNTDLSDGAARRTTEITLDVSEYGTVKNARDAWRDVVRTLESTCTGYVQVPGFPTTLTDGTNVTWTTNEFNEVTIAEDSREQGPLGLETLFTIVLLDPTDPTSMTLVASDLGMQYSSWRLAGSTIVRAEYAQVWNPMSAAAPSDPTDPFLTTEITETVDRLAKKASREITAKG